MMRSGNGPGPRREHCRRSPLRDARSNLSVLPASLGVTFLPSSHRGRGLCLHVELSSSPRPFEVEICAIWGRINPECIYIFHALTIT